MGANENEEEYGRLSLDEFRSLVKKLPELRAEMRDLPNVVRANPEKLKEILGPDCHAWAGIYELPLLEQMGLLFVAIGLHEPIIEAHQATGSAGQAWALFEDDSRLDQWYEANEDKIEKKYLLWLAIVLQRNILSIMLFYQSMGALVQAVREGDDEAFFRAVRIDRTVMACRTFADRISRAELVHDKNFILRLRSAIKGPSKKHMAAIQDLRYSIAVLREAGFDRFSDADLEALFIRTRLYPNSAGAMKALRKHLREARKLSST